MDVALKERFTGRRLLPHARATWRRASLWPIQRCSRLRPHRRRRRPVRVDERLRLSPARLDFSVMDSGIGLLHIEDCQDAQGGVALPPGVTLISLIDRNIAAVGDATAYRYLD